jgi:hypothetical protein
MDSGVMMYTYMPTLMKIDSGIQELIGQRLKPTLGEREKPVT